MRHTRGCQAKLGHDGGISESSRGHRSLEFYEKCALLLRRVSRGAAEREAVLLRAMLHALDHGKAHGQDRYEQDRQNGDWPSHIF